eukprot:3148482-Amphidinium_carterae.1
MSPKNELEQAEVPQQFTAARRSNGSQNSPRALGAMPYTSTATSSDTSAEPTMIVMAKQMIASIATSTEGVQTETVRMTEAISARQDLLTRRLEQVPEQVATVAGLRDKTIRTRHQSHTLELAADIACLKAKLSCMECNAREQVVALQDELLCAEQRSSLSEQAYISHIGEMNERAQRQQNLTNQQELRVEQVTSMSQSTVESLQQELVNAKSYVTPRRIHINTPDFGASLFLCLLRSLRSVSV